MNRTKISFLNAVSAIFLTLVNGLLGIVVTRLVISHFGSDFNGVNSTANQIINVLLILEGGFTLASNVALFEPISRQNFDTSNGVLAATRVRFRKIGLIFLAAGTVAAFGYSLIVKSNLSKKFVFTVIFMAVVPQAVNLFFATTYRVLLQTQQREYIISGFTALTIGLGHLTNIILIINHGQMWMVRFVTMCFALANSFLIVFYTKKENVFLDFSVDPMPDMIKGTGDVMAQKITGVIYTSWPIVFLSISPSGGSMLASVYAVYNSVFVLLKALLHGIIDAPRLGFGQMLTEKKKEEIWSVFKEYEYISLFFTFLAMTTACGLILPFISIYTRGITDIDYYDKTIAVLMVLIGTVEMLHIPSGHMINMSGNFKVSKNFQICACVLLIISMAGLGSLFGVYGMLASLLLVALLLAVLEIGFIHARFFLGKVSEFVKMVIPFMIAGAVISFFEMRISQGESGFLYFMLLGVAYMVLNILLDLFLGFLFSREEMLKLIHRGKNLMGRYFHRKNCSHEKRGDEV